jgi:proteasome lid subunit RPN8/RPN11
MSEISNWCDLKPDVIIDSVCSLLTTASSMPFELRKNRISLELHRAIIHSGQIPPILIATSCINRIYEHVNESNKEMGGLLIGRAYSLLENTEHGYDFVTIISDATPSLQYRNTSSSLWMSPELWSQTRPYLLVGKIVLGWYHSHPGIGVFFSGTDRTTQASFFSHPYCLGLVVDQIARNEKLFYGPKSIETSFRIVTGVEIYLPNNSTSHRSLNIA